MVGCKTNYNNINEWARDLKINEFRDFTYNSKVKKCSSNILKSNIETYSIILESERYTVNYSLVINLCDTFKIDFWNIYGDLFKDNIESNYDSLEISFYDSKYFITFKKSKYVEDDISEIIENLTELIDDIKKIIYTFEYMLYSKSFEESEDISYIDFLLDNKLFDKKQISLYKIIKQE